MNCVQATGLISESMERSLNWQENSRLKVHLMMCRGCRQFSHQVPVLRRISQRYARGETENSSR